MLRRFLWLKTKLNDITLKSVSNSSSFPTTNNVKTVARCVGRLSLLSANKTASVFVAGVEKKNIPKIQIRYRLWPGILFVCCCGWLSRHARGSLVLICACSKASELFTRTKISSSNKRWRRFVVASTWLGACSCFTLTLVQVSLWTNL